MKFEIKDTWSKFLNAVMGKGLLPKHNQRNGNVSIPVRIRVSLKSTKDAGDLLSYLEKSPGRHTSLLLALREGLDASYRDQDDSRERGVFVPRS